MTDMDIILLLVAKPVYNHKITLGMDLFFYWGGGGLADNFLKSNAFQTIFFITFCNENNFLTTIYKNATGFFIDLI